MNCTHVSVLYNYKMRKEQNLIKNKNLKHKGCNLIARKEFKNDKYYNQHEQENNRNHKGF